MKKIIVFIILFSSLFTASCSSNSKSDYVNKGNIVFISRMKNSEYWNVVKMGATAAASEFNANIELLATDYGDDVDGQIRLIEEALNKKADAIIIAPNDYNKLVKVLDKVNSKKIPIIVIDSEVNTDKINGFVGTNNYEAGKAAGEKIVELCGENSNIGILSLIQGAGNNEKREKGLTDVLASHPKINIMAKEESLSDPTLATILTRRLIERNPDLNGIVAMNDVLSEGAAEVIHEMKLEDKIKLVTFDSTTKEIGMLEKGVIKATIVQNPFSMGYLGVKNAVKVIKGESIQKNIDTGITVIDKKNMFDSKNQKLLFPFAK
ncbi:substrate-binding domain-containing protein [Desnuesiella massiliensis]|uniref:substrate-binding domain-containing protein n=1 Tax=Desnuesiella massiliensis TaxID=1650662 RepID=UPI0006E15333|nr:substrate-binding domain-containing protein [Desnuesiella massiliensis]